MKKLAPFLILLAGILWGSMGIFVRTLTANGLGTMEIVALRAMVTAGVLALFLLIYNRSLFKIRIRDIWCFIGTGIFSIAFFNFCYFKSITMTSMSVAAILLYTAPVIVMVLSFFLFKEQFTRRKVAGVILTFVGCMFVTGIFGEQTTVTVGGLFVGLGAGLGYALYSIFSRYALQRGYHSLTITFYTFLLAAVATLFLADITRVGQVVTKSGFMLAFAIAFGLLCTIVPYIVYTIGLRYMENGRASILASVEPVMATVFGAVVFREGLTLSGVIGMILVILAFVVTAEKNGKENGKKA